MFLLALDTSGPSGSVAVLRDEKILFEKNWMPANSLTVELPAKIEESLQETRLTLEQIEGFALTLGPGSFTGLRVGLGLVKGMAFSERKPVMGISSLEALAFPIHDFQGLVPMIDARRNEIYGAFFGYSRGEMETLLHERAEDPRDFLMEVKKKWHPQKEKLAFFGSGLRVYRERVEEIFSAEAVFLPEDFDKVRASSVGLLGLKACRKGNFSKGAQDLLPRYLRASEPEIKRGSGLTVKGGSTTLNQ